MIDAADLRANEQVAAAVELARAGAACGAKTVWARVKVPAVRLINIDP